MIKNKSFFTHTWNSWVGIFNLYIVFCNCVAWKWATASGRNAQFD